MRRPILLGESNPYSAALGDALSPRFPNSTGQRLWRLTGMAEDDYLASFDRRNLCRTRWSSKRAQRAARDLKKHLERDNVIVMLGHKVRRAMGDPPRGVQFLFIPHPSGRCRAYNDPSVRRRVRRLLRKLARESH